MLKLLGIKLQTQVAISLLKIHMLYHSIIIAKIITLEWLPLFLRCIQCGCGGGGFGESLPIWSLIGL